MKASSQFVKLRGLTAKLALSTFIIATASLAQSTGSIDDGAEDGPRATTAPAVATESSHSAPRYVSATVPKRVTVDQNRGREILTSFSMSSGYDTAVKDLSDASGPVVMTEGAMELTLHLRGLDVALQHDSLITRSFWTGLGLDQYQQTAASFSAMGERRTGWLLSLENGYGSDSARAEGSLNSSLTSAAPTPRFDPNAGSFTNGNTLTDHVAFAFRRRLSPLRTLDLHAGSYFHHFFENGASDEQYTVSAGVSDRWSQRHTFGLRAEAVEQHFPTSTCRTGSVTLSDRSQLSKRILFEGNIGPVMGWDNCSGTYEYHGILTIQSERGNRAYIGSSRQRTDGLIQNAAWEESSFGGLSAGQPRKLLAHFDVGYSRYLMANPSPSNPTEAGYFFSGGLRHRLSLWSEISFTGRFLNRNSNPTSLNRSVFLLTYTWSRENRRARSHISGDTHDEQ